ncbi:hypothetical protein SKAU_G00189750 [Synaphobranchus kaupii]|uniref:SAYSvFN domain-containing protein n=1 Tax=Synaphobranchus kaupii TaxID=118154 RepID=A0A9Q1FDG3_SYNKA|nr:hypothetical protein SKAU_G00189750 [Synaphobranchus kaupii]
MEQKLAEFRARKRDMEAKDCEAMGNQSKAQPGLSPKSASHAPPTNKMDKLEEPLKTESSLVIETTESPRAIPSWLMDSAVGRWLGKTNLTLLKGLRKPAARQPGELSAYSVFNPDCQPLLGTLTAQQLEGEMGYMMLANN